MPFDLLHLPDQDPGTWATAIVAAVLSNLNPDLRLAFNLAAAARITSTKELGRVLDDDDLARTVFSGPATGAFFAHVSDGQFAMPKQFRGALRLALWTQTELVLHHGTWYDYLSSQSDLAPRLEAVYHGIISDADSAILLLIRTLDECEGKSRYGEIDRMGQKLQPLLEENLSRSAHVAINYVLAKSQLRSGEHLAAASNAALLLSFEDLPTLLSGRIEQLLADSLIANNDYIGAAEHYRKSSEFLKLDSPASRIRALLSYANSLHLGGQSQTASAAYRIALDESRSGHLEIEAARALIGLAQTEPDPTVAEGSFREAIELLSSLNNEVDAAYAKIQWARRLLSAHSEGFRDESPERAVDNLLQALDICSKYNWTSGTSDAIDLLQLLLAESIDRNAIVSQVSNLQSAVPLQALVHVISTENEARRRDVSREKTCLLSMSSLLNLYADNNTAKADPWYLLTEFQSALASIRSTESETLILYGVLLKFARRSLSRYGRAVISESLCFEALRLRLLDRAANYAGELGEHGRLHGEPVLAALVAGDFSTANELLLATTKDQFDSSLFEIGRFWRYHGFVSLHTGQEPKAMIAFLKGILAFSQLGELAAEAQMWQLYREAALAIHDTDAAQEARDRTQALSQAFKLPFEAGILVY